MNRYTANIHLENGELLNKSGEDIDRLYKWMLVQANDYSCIIYGEIVGNTNNQIIKQFLKAASCK
ncbi:hypothetical protein [Legionella gresilensis]|uniref:hypothetical protein n=1 Tax=Legionella gresilensis TaxID=91823 RepID=UPI0010419D04|nr:hypothetical protein [Legionella gresilensis]